MRAVRQRIRRVVVEGDIHTQNVKLPPASDQMIAFCPWGPTSRKSRSSEKKWMSERKVTVTLTTVPWHATTMFDGYGLAGPLLGTMIGAGLLKKTGVHVGVAVGVGVPAPPYLCPPASRTTRPVAEVLGEIGLVQLDSSSGTGVAVGYGTVDHVEGRLCFV